MRLEWNTTNTIIMPEDVIKWAKKMAKAARKAIRSWQRLMKIFAIQSYRGNPRVKHLALHARKARTRKKNYYRILKENRRNR